MSFQKILVPVDIDGYADDAIDKSIELAKLSNGIITALHVSAKNDDLDKKTVETVVKKGNASNIKVETKITNGNPAEIILSESRNFDIIVMGTSGKKKILSGSVAKAVIKCAECPVIVVRSQR